MRSKSSRLAEPSSSPSTQMGLVAGRWSSLQNGFANLSGIVAPWVTGLIVQINGSARLAFVITGGVALAGAVFWGLLVQRVEQVQWEASNCM